LTGVMPCKGRAAEPGMMRCQGGSPSCGAVHSEITTVSTEQALGRAHNNDVISYGARAECHNSSRSSRGHGTLTA
jgi:hypothetical protein